MCRLIYSRNRHVHPYMGNQVFTQVLGHLLMPAQRKAQTLQVCMGNSTVCVWLSHKDIADMQA